MDKSARRAFLKGILMLSVIGVIIAAYLTIRSEVKVAQSGVVATETYNVAVDYSGLITEQIVGVGDYVEAGQELAYIKSSALREDLNEKRVGADDLLYPLDDKKQIIIVAPQTGEISEIAFSEGSFVPANQTIYTIQDVDRPYVESKFELTSDEFEKLDKKSRLEVRLPNGEYYDSPITLIEIETEEDNDSELIQVALRSSLEADGNLLVGAPVESRLYLETNTLLQGLFDRASTLWE